MGITKTFKKLLGHSGIEDHSTANEELLQNSPSTDGVPDSSGKDERNKKQNRQVGSKWEHKHDDLDWHSMSIPHPLAVTEKDVPDEPAAVEISFQPNDSSEQADEKGISKQDILCKFVVQHGQRIGETISIYSGYLVFKKGAENLSIPMSSILDITDEDVVVDDFERNEALRLGEDWHQRTTDSLKFDEKGMLIYD
ncbi:MAG: hypothetical protein M8349_05230 [ANME-2 cluster archaeon]|nr:hypothetical protein [ANME-2 cluster archaeon]